MATLGKVMLDSETPASTRVRAAGSILDHTAKAIEIEEIEARVALGNARPDLRAGFGRCRLPGRPGDL